MKRISAVLILVLCVCLLAGCSCKHEWEAATCTAAETCRLCQKTNGEPLSHVWAEATCETPRQCTLCGLTEGEALGHRWSALTCEEEYVCSVCSLASGITGPHVDVRNITQDIDNNLLVQCKCGNEQILSVEDLMLQLMQGKWTLRAVLKENSLFRPDPKTYWEEGTWFEFPGKAEPTAYEVGISEVGAQFVFLQNLQEFQLTTAALYANGPKLAVLMCNARTEYGEDVYGDTPMILVFGDRNYAKEGISDDDFINAAMKGSITSLWRYNDGVMYIYGYDLST